MSIEKNEFSRREWMMIIAIFLMSEAWILNLSYAFVDEQSVINYVSFASTITSLILAILAIIYGFYQNENGKKSNAALEGNIDSLKLTQGKLDDFINKVDKNLTSINDSSVKLKHIGDTFSSSVNKIDELNKTIEHIKNNQDEGNTDIKSLMLQLKQYVHTSDKVDEFASKGDLSSLEVILKNTGVFADLVCIMIIEANINKFTGNRISLVVKHFGKPLGEYVKRDDFNKEENFRVLQDYNSVTLSAVALELLVVLDSFNVGDVGADEPMVFNNDFIAVLEKHSTGLSKNIKMQNISNVIKNSFV